MIAKRPRRAISLAAILVLTTMLTGVKGPTAAPIAQAASFQVATDATTYALCGRIFPDPHAYWPSPAQAAGRSPFAKGNAPCSATDFLSYAQMVEGATFMESLFPEFVEFYRLEEDFGDGGDCATSTDPRDYCTAGLPRQGVTAGRERTDLYMLRITDERVSDTNKKFFTFPLSIHGIERAGAEAGVRAAEDLATWGACEAGLAPATVDCAKEGAIPHPLLETTPDDSVTAGAALASSAIYFVFANPDGWRRGDPDNAPRFFQRYNGNGVDVNRDWPTIGYTFEPYTPWSEPESRAFGQVMKSIRGTWDGGIDLHGQLIDDAFSFTLLGASERDFPKNQRILQSVKGAWADAERRLAWSPAIKPNDAAPDDPGVYGVQWGTVWDTIDYTVTGSLGDWIDSPLGLGADGIDNEMSLSHLSNCGIGSCYLPDAEQLHVDGNKSLIYSMVNFTLLPEETTFAVPEGRVGYVFDPTVVSSDGAPTPPPTEGLPPQAPILDASLDATNGFSYEFEVLGPSAGVYNGGVEGKATAMNAGSVSPGSAVSSLVLERYRPDEPEAVEDGCTADDANWAEVNTYFNQSFVYLQAGQAVHGNMPLPGRYRICLTGGLASQFAGAGASMDLDIVFSTEQAWEDPGQVPYEVTNMAFFEDLAAHVAPAELVPVQVDEILDGSVALDDFSSLVIADDPFPGYSEAAPTGLAQEGATHTSPGLGTAPCAYQEGTTPVLPPTCVHDIEFAVSPDFNNQRVAVTLSTNNADLNDWDLYVERFGQTTGDWSPVGKSTTGTGNEQVTILSPLAGQYRARVVNWSAADITSAETLEIAFSNEYAGPPIEPSTRTDEELATWAAALRGFAEGGGNLVLTDGAIRNAAYMDIVPRTRVNTFSAYAGFIGFTANGGQTNTYDDPLAANVDQPGAAEGPANRHQTYEPVPIGFAIQNADGADFNGSPIWSVDQLAWEAAGGRTAGTTTADQATLGEIALGSGVVRIIGPLLPMPSEAYYHPFGLANYALTYSGYQVLNNALQWERPLPDLTIAPADVSFSSTKVRGGDQVVVMATVHNVGGAGATNIPVRFEVDGQQLGEVQTIASIAAGGSGTASVSWNTKHADGDHAISVTADPANAIREVDESNNVASGTVTVRGNKVRNSSFEQPNSAGSGPDGWSGSSTAAGTANWSEGGSEGTRSASFTGTGGNAVLAGVPTWTSDPIAVTAGEVLTLTAKVQVSGASSAPSVGLAYLGPAGALLQQVTVLTAPLTTDGFALLEQNVTIPSGVASVRVVLAGFAPTDTRTAGTVTFDEIGLFAQ